MSDEYDQNLSRNNRGSVTASSPARTPHWASVIATFGGIGHLKPGPGTWASVSTVILWALIRWRVPITARAWVTITACAAVTIIGIQAATLVVRSSGVKDPQFVVIDEVAGQLVALIAVPLAWKTFLAGLILFRVFDIVKPPPVRQLERLPEGIGIVVDDVAAGIYALALMQLLLYFGLLSR